MKIGIDLGGTKLAAGIVDDEYHIVAQKSVKTQKERHPNEIIKDMAATCLDLINHVGLCIEQIQSIGIGSPGILDKNTGEVIYSNNIQWEHVNLRNELHKYLPRPIFIDNDANCAALGEFICGASKEYSSSLMITLGTGVGGGLILDGKLHSGLNSAANCIGHAVIVSGGEPCTCGRVGCWEAYASVTALIRMAQKIALEQPESIFAKFLENGEELNGKNIFEAAKTGDPYATDLVDKYIFYVAEGVTNLVNILQPEVIVIGGGLSKEGEFLLAPIRSFVKNNVFCKSIEIPKIKIAQLGNNAGIVGAAFLESYQVQSK